MHDERTYLISTDDFFKSRSCDRCKSEDAKIIHTMSWFTEERICITCSGEEDKIKKRMREKEMDPSKFEGCGYIPKI